MNQTDAGVFGLANGLQPFHIHRSLLITLAGLHGGIFFAHLLLRGGSLENAQSVTASKSVESTTAVPIDMGPPRFSVFLPHRQETHLPARLWDNHGVVAMVLHATCYTDLKRYGHLCHSGFGKKQSRQSAPSISGYKETREIEYAADTTLDHMAEMDENESPVEVHLTKN